MVLNSGQFKSLDLMSVYVTSIGECFKLFGNLWQFFKWFKQVGKLWHFFKCFWLFDNLWQVPAEYLQWRVGVLPCFIKLSCNHESPLRNNILITWQFQDICPSRVWAIRIWDHLCCTRWHRWHRQGPREPQRPRVTLEKLLTLITIKKVRVTRPFLIEYKRGSGC